MNSDASNSGNEQTSRGIINNAKTKSDNEWKKLLTSQQYEILRNAGTKYPFTGSLLNKKREKTYFSVGCDQPFFSSEQKYETGAGWPSYWNPISEDTLILKGEYKLGYKRIEILDKCSGHLGQITEDKPQLTEKIYCINSVALYFVPSEKKLYPADLWILL